MWKKALVVIDMLNDFILEDGALPVKGGINFIPKINELKNKFDVTIFVNDAHDENDVEFDVWPIHCVKGTKGAKIVEGININTNDVMFEKKELSCFTNPDFHKYLIKNKIDTLYIAGVATEYCVYNAVLDARKLGFDVYVFEDCIAGVDLKEGDVARALIDMGAVGAIPIKSERFITCTI